MNSHLSKFFRFGKSDLLVFFFFVCLAGVGATLLLWGKPQSKEDILPKANQPTPNAQETPLYSYLRSEEKPGSLRQSRA